MESNLISRMGTQSDAALFDIKSVRAPEIGQAALATYDPMRYTRASFFDPLLLRGDYLL